MKKELMIEGMKCEGCASTVVEKLQAVEGVERSSRSQTEHLGHEVARHRVPRLANQQVAILPRQFGECLADAEVEGR